MKIVDFETAKLAKEKGFNELVTHYYSMVLDTDSDKKYWKLESHFENAYRGWVLFDMIHPEQRKRKTFEDIFSKFNNDNVISQTFHISAPYQCRLMDWLREKRNIYISILQTNLPLTDPQTDEWEWGYYIYEIDDPTNLLKSNWEFETYEECLETALQEALKLIE